MCRAVDILIYQQNDILMYPRSLPDTAYLMRSSSGTLRGSSDQINMFAAILWREKKIKIIRLDKICVLLSATICYGWQPNKEKRKMGDC